MNKRVVSTILAIVMIVAMLPLNIISANNSGETAASISYEFNTSCGVAGNTQLPQITDYGQTGNKWKYYSASRTSTHQVKDGYFLGDTRTVDHYIALNINVPDAGMYAVEYFYTKMKDEGGKGDVYLVPGATFASLSEAKTSGTKIASVDYSGEGISYGIKAESLVEYVTLPAGDNIILFVVAGKGEKSIANSVRDYFTYPSALALTPLDESEIEPGPEPEPEEQIEARYVFDNLELGVPGNTRIDTITSYEQTGNTWRFLNGSPHAKGSGLCNYYLNGDTRAVDQFIAIEINVPADGTYAPEILHYKMKGEGGTGDVYILPEGGLTNLAEAKANGTKIASIDYSGDATVGNVEAEMLVDAIELKEGTNVLLFVVTGTGAKATTASVRDYFTYPYMLTLTPVEEKESEPEPVERSYIFDNLALGVPGNTRIDTITSYEQTGNTWRFLNGSPHAKGSALCNYYLRGDTRAVDQFIAIEINVPADGTYAPEILHYKMKGEGGTGDVYILPEGGLTNLAEAKANGTKIASIDYSGDATVGNVEAEMLVDAIELKEGTNVLLFVVTGTGAKATTASVRDYFTYPYMLTLKPTEGGAEGDEGEGEGEGEEQSAKRNYIFDNLSIGVAGNTVISTITSYEQTGGLWRYLAGSPNAKNSQLKNYYLNGDTRAVDHFIALEINVPRDGVYVPEFFYQTIAERGGTGDIYILPEGGLTNLAEAKANGTKIASVDYSSDVTEGNVKAKMSVSEIELKKGTNVLLFVVTGKGAKATTGDAIDYFTYPYMLSITPIEEVPPTTLSGVKHVYDFKENNTLSSGERKIIAEGESAAESFPASATDGWSAYAYSAGAEYIQKNNSENITFVQKDGEYLQLSSMKTGEWIAIKLPLENRGSYNAFLSYKQIQGYGAADIYAIPMPEEELDEEGKRAYVDKMLKNATRVTSINSHNVNNLSIENAPRAAEFTVGTTTADSGILLVFKSTGNKKILLDNIILDGTGEVEGVENVAETVYTLRPGKALKEAGESATLSLFDEKGAEVKDFEISDITSSDEGVVMVSGKTVTAGNKYGRAKLSATVTVNGNSVKAEGSVRFVKDAMAGENVAININARKETWTNPGYLRDPSLYSSLERAQTDITGFEIGDGITEEYTDGWSWYADSVDEQTETSFMQRNKIVFSARMEDGAWFAVKTKFDAAGKYRAIVTHRASVQSPYADMYFIPVPKEGEKVADFLTDEYRVGRINSHNPDAVAWNAANATTETYLGDVYAEEAGEYLAVIMMTGRAATGKMYLYYEDFAFNGKNPIVSIGGAWEEAVGVGDTVTLDKSLVTYEADIPQYREGTTLSFRSLTPDIVSVDENGVVTGVGNGEGKIEVTATYDGDSVVGEYTIIVGSGKTRRSYYTDEKVANAKRNVGRYDWALNEYNKWIKAADKFVEKGEDKLYNLVTTQELPRSLDLSYRFGDTGAYVCIYCDKELSNKYGLYPWVIDVFNEPWKIQCPECKRYFPSNDFGSFYKLGIDENGNYDYELALQKHHEKFVCANGEDCSCNTNVGERGSDVWKDYYGYGKGYLKNTLHSYVGSTLGIAPEEVDRWAVDDGWGYEYEYEVKNGSTETRCKPFIAYYNTWGIWEETIPDAIESLGMAYLYTGEMKYGRLGAILLDRVADVYPDFDVSHLGSTFLLADGSMVTKYADGTIKGTSRGGILGRLHDCNIGLQMVPAYDALWPAYEDESVIKYLSGKAAEMNLENPKTSAFAIRTNIENRYLREINKRIHDYRISANFTVPEKLHILAAVVLDTMPETQEWLQFVFQAGKQTGYSNVTGGNVYPQIINVVDRDGHGNEAAAGYNTGWVDNLVLLGEALDGYDRAGGYNLFENPKFKRMLKSEIDTICASVWTPNIGDYIAMGRQHLSPYHTSLIRAYQVFDDDPEYQEIILKALYHRSRREYTYIHGSIFDEDPEEIKRATERIVGESLELGLPSRDLAGYGIAILRDGAWLDSANVNKNINTQRGFYIYYGQTNGHGHADKLTLGVYGFGFDMGSDLGTPRLKTSTDPQRFELVEHTMAHNTVMVNNLNQRVTLDGNPMHFDSSDKVQLMDVEAPEVYDWIGVKEYRRTLVMVDVDDDVSYGVDFFRVLGGKDHVYSFHAVGKEAVLSDNVEVKKQTDENGNYIGSYQGEDKIWGSSNINSMDISNLFGGQHGAYDIDRDLGGTTDGLGTESWFGEVDRAVDPANVGTFSADWKIFDGYGVLKPANNDLGVKLTMVNSFKLDEITTASVLPPQVEGAMDKARYLFARRTGEAEGIKGKELDSLFTAVVEPYDGENYISSVEPVSVSREDGKEFSFDEAKAVKVILNNGREDYIVYAKDNTVRYKVAYTTADGESTFEFSGFVGVVSVKDGKIIYTYINDGTTIADNNDLIPAYTGKIVGFEEELSEENYIDIALDIVPEDLTMFDNRYIYVDNGLTDNGAYLIEKAYSTDSGVRLEIGDTTLITSYVDDYNFDKGYNYNIAKGNSFRIPMSYVDTNAPVFNEVSGSLTASAGNLITVKISAESPLGEAVSYSATRLPRGANFDEETATITWKPTSGQTGRNIVSIDATDESGRVTRQTFEIQVYGSTTGTGSGGTGGGGGGAAPAPSKPVEDDKKEEDKKEDVPTTPSEPSTPSVDENVRFVDLGAHAWAEDAINALAEDGIIKGTSENTFSPAANITRADFALLLVRAFKLSSDNTENFADVAESDYFAKELAIARNTGIAGGIGDNKYAPRNTITRQDMMTIVYRAMQKLDAEFGAYDEPQYDDFANVAEYAKDAVKTLIGAGLVNGKSGKIAPTDYTTRAEVAVLIKRILDYTNK